MPTIRGSDWLLFQPVHGQRQRPLRDRLWNVRTKNLKPKGVCAQTQIVRITLKSLYYVGRPKLNSSTNRHQKVGEMPFPRSQVPFTLSEQLSVDERGTSVYGIGPAVNLKRNDHSGGVLEEVVYHGRREAK